MKYISVAILIFFAATLLSIKAQYDDVPGSIFLGNDCKFLTETFNAGMSKYFSKFLVRRNEKRQSSEDASDFDGLRVK